MRCIVCNAYKVRKVISLNTTNNNVKYYCNKCDSVWERDVSGEVINIWKSDSFMKGD
jgi:hypothetical protein